jgi:hypothetical protein
MHHDPLAALGTTRNRFRRLALGLSLSGQCGSLLASLADRQLGSAVRTAQPHRPYLGARVAPQRCPIFRVVRFTLLDLLAI